MPDLGKRVLAQATQFEIGQPLAGTYESFRRDRATDNSGTAGAGIAGPSGVPAGSEELLVLFIGQELYQRRPIAVSLGDERSSMDAMRNTQIVHLLLKPLDAVEVVSHSHKFRDQREFGPRQEPYCIHGFFVRSRTAGQGVMHLGRGPVKADVERLQVRAHGIEMLQELFVDQRTVRVDSERKPKFASR